MSQLFREEPVHARQCVGSIVWPVTRLVVGVFEGMPRIGIDFGVYGLAQRLHRGFERMDGQMNDGEPAKRLLFELSLGGLLTEEFDAAVGEYGNGVFNLGARGGKRRQLRLSLRIENTGRARRVGHLPGKRVVRRSE